MFTDILITVTQENWAEDIKETEDLKLHLNLGRYITVCHPRRNVCLLKTDPGGNIVQI